MNKAYGSLRECCPQGPQLSAMKASIFKVGQYWWECSVVSVLLLVKSKVSPLESERPTEEDTYLLTK